MFIFEKFQQTLQRADKSSMRTRGLLFLVLQLVVVFGLAIRSGALSRESSIMKTPKCQSWRKLELDSRAWEITYDGYGAVALQEPMSLSPAVATVPEETHAALVLSKENLPASPWGVRIVYENQKPLRSPASNPWEVFWLFFDYNGAIDQKTTNYMILKPNGVELGKAWGQVDQDFLATRSEPQIQYGQTYELSLFRMGSRVQAYLNGAGILEFEETPEKTLFRSPGRLGLYSEDAQVAIHRVEICDSLESGFKRWFF